MQGLSSLIVIVAMFAIIYFVTIRPQQKQQKEIREMQDSLEVGDSVITIGGIVGKIVIIKDDYLTIETAGEKTRIELTKWGIGAKQDK